MNRIYLAGRGLACSLGLDLHQALAALRLPPSPPACYPLPGAPHSDYPFHALPFQSTDWNSRARNLVRQVAGEACAERVKNGALFVASSSLDIGAAEQGMADLDLNGFVEKVAGWLDWQGPVYLVSTACTSSMNALLSAHAMLRKGGITDALVVGMELANRATLGGFAAMQLLSPSACRPFAAERDGLVLGEAVAAVRLSTRDMGPWCMLGGANVVDGSQPTGASPDAVSAMFQRALADCGLDPQAIDLIKVQAAGSPGNDAAEAVGLQQAFSELPALVSLKAAMGHTMGASGAAEISLLTACVEHGEWPDVSTECDPSLGVSLAKQPPHDVRRVMATILGFGGSHATVVLERSGP